MRRNTRGTRALVTGGMGFVGSHLAERLVADGYEVTLLDDLSTGRWENVASLLPHPAVHAVVGSVTDQELVDLLVSRSDVVFHLAAALGVQLILADPLGCARTNLDGTERVLDAAARTGVKVLIASTSEVYGKTPRLPFAEDDDVLLGPTARSRWSYAASKMMDEFLGLAYHEQLGLPVVVFRLFNTVGPRQTGRYGMVVPRFVEAALRGDPLLVYGDGAQSRCFLHVSDAVSAIIELADHPEAPGSVFNVGSTELVTIQGLAEQTLDQVRRLTGRSPATDQPIRFVSYEEAYGPGFEDMHSRLPDVHRIHELTGWERHLDLCDILRDVIVERYADGRAPMRSIVGPPLSTNGHAPGRALESALVNGPAAG